MPCFCIVQGCHNNILRRTVASARQQEFSCMHSSFVAHRAFRNINTGYPEHQLLPGFGHVFIPGIMNAMQILTTHLKIVLAVSVAQQAIMSDLYKSVRQHMEQEPADELRSLQRHYLIFVPIRIITPHEGNRAILHTDDPVISYGNTMRISAEIPEDPFSAVERRLTVYNPFTAVQVFQELSECFLILQVTGAGQFVSVIALSEIIEELSPEQSGHNLHREEELLFA